MIGGFILHLFFIVRLKGFPVLCGDSVKGFDSWQKTKPLARIIMEIR